MAVDKSFFSEGFLVHLHEEKKMYVKIKATQYHESTYKNGITVTNFILVS